MGNAHHVIAILAREFEWLNKHPQENQALYQKVSGLPSDVVKKTFERRPVDGVLPLNPQLINELQAGEIVWEYINTYFASREIAGEKAAVSRGEQNSVFRAFRYAPEQVPWL